MYTNGARKAYSQRGIHLIASTCVLLTPIWTVKIFLLWSMYFLQLGQTNPKNEGSFYLGKVPFWSQCHILILHILTVSLAFKVNPRKIQEKQSENWKKKRENDIKREPTMQIIFLFLHMAKTPQPKTMRYSWCWVEPTTFSLPNS